MRFFISVCNSISLSSRTLANRLIKASLADDVCYKLLDKVKCVELGFMTRTDNPTHSCRELLEPHVDDLIVHTAQ